MIRYLPVPLAIAVTFSVKLAALLFWVFLFLLPGTLIKILVPLPAVRRVMTRYLVWVGSSWTATNVYIYRLLLPPYRRVDLPQNLDPRHSYMLICNHQSWADILILFAVFSGRVPWLRFFLKKELIWLPIVGQVCWALDFPFMQRHSQKAVAMNPQRARQDLETTRRFCERFRGEPITVVNFLDGTRFTEKKRVERKSPYRHLLRPKSAGMSFTLAAMGDQLAGVIDVTIFYGTGDGKPLWRFLAGRQRDIVIEAKLRPIDAKWLGGDYQSDPEFRRGFQEWVSAMWTEKDERLEALRQA
jgi:1-acyl-sn-glycerol-3-phosphate acyltransferase